MNVPSRSIAPMRSPSPSAHSPASYLPASTARRSASTCGSMGSGFTPPNSGSRVPRISSHAMPCLRHQFAQQSARRAVHRVHDEPELGRADSVPVHHFLDGFEIRRKNVQRLDAIRLRRQWRHAVRQHRGKFLFHLRDNRRQRRASVARLEFHAVPFVRIVARGDHDPARRAALPHQQRKRRRRARLLRDPHRHPGHRDHFRRRARKPLGAEARVVPDEHARLGFFRAHHVPRDRARHLAHIRKREILGDYAAPAIGAKFNCAHSSDSICEAGECEK